MSLFSSVSPFGRERIHPTTEVAGTLRSSVDNEGVAPDVEVEMTPREVADGHDPQLERAVSLVLAELEAHPPQSGTRPSSVRRAVKDESAGSNL